MAAGEGVAAEHREQIFNPFFTTKQNEGTGLGLMMCHHIIEEHRGSIDVHSELGKGTTMTIHLPINLTEFNRSKSDRTSPAPSVDQ